MLTSESPEPGNVTTVTLQKSGSWDEEITPGGSNVIEAVLIRKMQKESERRGHNEGSRCW